MRNRLVVHIWGFYDDAGHPRQPDSAAAEEGSVYATHKAVEANVLRHGGNITDLRVTRTLDGLLVGTEFDVPAHGGAARLWHRIIRSSEPWNARTDQADEAVEEETSVLVSDAQAPAIEEWGLIVITRGGKTLLPEAEVCQSLEQAEERARQERSFGMTVIVASRRVTEWQPVDAPEGESLGGDL